MFPPVFVGSLAACGQNREGGSFPGAFSFMKLGSQSLVLLIFPSVGFTGLLTKGYELIARMKSLGGSGECQLEAKAKSEDRLQVSRVFCLEGL